MDEATTDGVQQEKSQATVLYERWQKTLTTYGMADAVAAEVIPLLAEAVDDELIGRESDQSDTFIRENPVEWTAIQTRAQLRKELTGMLDEISGHEE